MGSILLQKGNGPGSTLFRLFTAVSSCLNSYNNSNNNSSNNNKQGASYIPNWASWRRFDWIGFSDQHKRKKCYPKGLPLALFLFLSYGLQPFISFLFNLSFPFLGRPTRVVKNSGFGKTTILRFFLQTKIECYLAMKSCLPCLSPLKQSFRFER